jgi:hypothetical protein
MVKSSKTPGSDTNLPPKLAKAMGIKQEPEILRYKSAGAKRRPKSETEKAIDKVERAIKNVLKSTA